MRRAPHRLPFALVPPRKTMTETTTPPAPPGDAAPRRRRRRALPRVFIVAGVVLVLALAAAAIYAVTIDRSVTQNITRGVDLPGDSPSPGQTATADEGAAGDRHAQLRAARLRQPRSQQRGQRTQRLDHGRAPERQPEQGLHHLLPPRHVRQHSRLRQEQDQRTRSPSAARRSPFARWRTSPGYGWTTSCWSTSRASSN